MQHGMSQKVAVWIQMNMCYNNYICLETSCQHWWTVAVEVENWCEKASLC